MANRKERRAARKNSPLRQYKVGVAKGTTLPPDTIHDLLGSLYERYPTLPPDKVLVQLFSTVDTQTNQPGHFILTADPEDKRISIGPVTAEQHAAFTKEIEESGVAEITKYNPELDRYWQIEMDARIKDGWVRNDPLMPTEAMVRAVLDDIIKQFREQLHQRDAGTISTLSHRRPRDPDNYVRLYAELHPKERRIQIIALMTPEAEQSCQDWMDDPSDGDLSGGHVSVDPHATIQWMQ
jgi:hypothetical protein